MIPHIDSETRKLIDDLIRLLDEMEPELPSAVVVHLFDRELTIDPSTWGPPGEWNEDGSKWIAAIEAPATSLIDLDLARSIRIPSTMAVEAATTHQRHDNDNNKDCEHSEFLQV
jgi:hypothetical protein